MSTVQPKKGEDCQDPLHGVRIKVVREDGDTDHRHPCMDVSAKEAADMY